MLRATAGKLDFDANAAVATLRASVQSLLTARVDRLAAEDQAASGIGRRFDPQVPAVAVDEANDGTQLAAIRARLDPCRRQIWRFCFQARTGSGCTLS
jgi:hypothetical protein